MGFKILVVDDGDSIRDAIERILKGKNFIIDTARNGREALFKTENFKPDLILLDIQLGDANGIDVLKIIKEKYSDIIIIMITSFPKTDLAIKAMKIGAYDFIEKPFRKEHLLLIIEKALETLKLKKEVKTLRAMHVDSGDSIQIIGNSPEMQQVLSDAEKFAQANIPILIEGESGTGKKLLAKFIHYRSNRLAKPFVLVDCGAFPEHSFESELFGCVDGAFNKAKTLGKPGFVEQAESGTLFLGEISRMPLNTQINLLRLLEHKAYNRVGDPIPKKADIRVIVASSLKMDEAIKNGLIREALFYHLKPSRIILPPLRQKKSDIIPLAKYFTAQTNKFFNKNVEGFTTDAEHLLTFFPWKGNVRQLKNMIERAVLLTANPIIDTDGLALAGIEQEEHVFHLLVKLNKDPQNGNVLRTTMGQIIKKTLEISHGNKSLASQYLGIPRGTFRHHLSKLN